MVKATDSAAVAVGALLALALFVWARVEAPAPGGAAAATPAPSARAVSEVPRIDLARLDAERPDSAAGSRDVFDFGGPAPPPPGAGPGVEALPGTPPPTVAIEPTPTPLPSLSVRFVGAVETGGTRVAVLMTDKKEILTGQAGDVVANRLRIVRIGLESVDVQDVGGGAPRRLPLRAN
jgi:hypothetical protein